MNISHRIQNNQRYFTIEAEDNEEAEFLYDFSLRCDPATVTYKKDPAFKHPHLIIERKYP